MKNVISFSNDKAELKVIQLGRGEIMIPTQTKSVPFHNITKYRGFVIEVQRPGFDSKR